MLRLGELTGNFARASAQPKAAMFQKVAWFASEKKSSPETGGSKTSGGDGGNFKPRWWKPDPVTGVWVPEESEGQIDAVEMEAKYRFRSEPTASLDERAWWSSMEEVPDRIK
ncbi:hypothetical protein SUGI_0910310 [Cryptomeria japonica]|nr:hypothetical protein SUGI_0910310 [Cryptomeria japonica]